MPEKVIQAFLPSEPVVSAAISSAPRPVAAERAPDLDLLAHLQRARELDAAARRARPCRAGSRPPCGRTRRAGAGDRSSLPEKNVSAVGVHFGSLASWALPPAIWTLIDVTWPSRRPAHRDRALDARALDLHRDGPGGHPGEDELAVLVDLARQRGARRRPPAGPTAGPSPCPAGGAAPVARARPAPTTCDGTPDPPTARNAASAPASPARTRHTSMLATHDMASFLLLAARLTPRRGAPWLCVPGLPRVCSEQEVDSRAHRPVALHARPSGAPRAVSSLTSRRDCARQHALRERKLDNGTRKRRVETWTKKRKRKRNSADRLNGGQSRPRAPDARLRLGAQGPRRRPGQPVRRARPHRPRAPGHRPRPRRAGGRGGRSRGAGAPAHGRDRPAASGGRRLAVGFARTR